MGWATLLFYIAKQLLLGKKSVSKYLKNGFHFRLPLSVAIPIKCEHFTVYAFTLPLAQMSENGNVSMGLIINLLELSLWPNCSIIIFFSPCVWHFGFATDKAVRVCGCVCVLYTLGCT